MTIKQQVQFVSDQLSAILASWTEEQPGGTPTPTPAPSTPVADPRTERMKGYAQTAGKVTSVKGIFIPQPDTRFQLVDFDLITEDEAKNDTMAIVNVYRWANVGGETILIPARVNVMLAWPLQGTDPQTLEMAIPPGNTSFPYRHIIQSGYTPPKTGPLAIYVADDQGNIASDVAGGLGMPVNRHIGFLLTFVERREWGK